MDNDKIKIKASSPALQKKIKTNISFGSDVVHWYMRFNLPLDPDSVSHKTMEVMDTDGYIMRTEITYNRHNNVIIISPIDSYEQNIYYILSVSKKVKSEKGQYLKNEIHILFKLLENRISEFQILKSTVKLPEPKPRPKNYEQRFRDTKSRVYSFEKELLTNLPQDKLPMADLKINLLPGLGGFVVMVASIFIPATMALLAGIAICVLGAGHIFFQLSRKKTLSVVQYNKGARLFNGEKYQRAEVYFKKALVYDPGNEFAEYASNKVGFYIG